MSEFSFSPTFERDIKTLSAVGEVCYKIANDVRNTYVGMVPKTKADNWNKVAKNVDVVNHFDSWNGYRSFVLTEANARVRHAMFLEYGWTDKKGVKHPGGHYLLNALTKVAVR
ncbi:hypothetical protein [Streptomyces sp. 769]|uniref:hypothetical protein n=1 Tax=Streptomyces sp. 769 TaxID=1262452 RepID=UPI00057D36DC|nr:hypothetical protein [Streptomyces sp. 769]AJC53994.1 hypothetical protein GZL_01394 [Streptomyces sp. 769]